MATNSNPATQLLNISASAYEEIKHRLEILGQQDRVEERDIETNGVITGKQVTLNMDGFVLGRETDERVKVWILLEGKKL